MFAGQPEALDATVRRGRPQFDLSDGFMPGRVSRLLRRARSLLAPTVPVPVPLPLPDHMIALASPEGIALLESSPFAGDYLRLAPHLVSQESPKFCGPATIAMCLNALHLTPPQGAGAVRPRFTQRNIFTPETSALRSQEEVMHEGMGLEVLARFVDAHGGRADVRFAEHSSLDEFRAAAFRVLADPRRFLVVNYLRPVLRQEGRGHTSPIAAYDVDSDRFLMLDVSRVSYTPAWVKACDLFKAMDTRAGRNTRGYAIISAA